MSRWGMGMSACDEFAEVKDDFFECFYYRNMSVPQIEQDILEYYESQFEAGDGVLHDVYFALADCEWRCGQLSDRVRDEVRRIIEEGRDTEFLKELYACPADLRRREEVLQKFLAKILSENPKPIRQRQKPIYKVPFSIGDIVAYRYGDGYYGCVVLDVLDLEPNTIGKSKYSYNILIAIGRSYTPTPPDPQDVPNDEIRSVHWDSLCWFPPKKHWILLGNIADRIDRDYTMYLGMYNTKRMIATYGGCGANWDSIFAPDYDARRNAREAGVLGQPIKHLFRKANLTRTDRLPAFAADIRKGLRFAD